MLCTVPFLWEYHGVPGDYHRWTDQGLRADLERRGFGSVETTPVETQSESLVTLGALVAARKLGWFWTKPLFLAANVCARALGSGTNRMFTLTYACRAEKPIHP